MAQLGISGMACWATGVMMRPESSILELWEIASEVAIAASVSEISDSSRSLDLRSVRRPSGLLHVSRARERYWEPDSHGLREA